MVVTTVTTGDYPYSFEDLARELRTPGTTLRRYFKVFHMFIPNKLVKRAVRFNDEGKELFETINKMYGDRIGTDEIMATIATTRMPTLDIRPSPPTPDRQSSAPALPEVIAALLPLAERFVAALETIAARMTVEDVPNSPYKRTDKPGGINHHPDHQTGQESPLVNMVDKEALVLEVMRMRAMGYGASRIRTTLVKAGWPSLAGPGHRLSKSTIAKIIKSNGSDV
jgi:hypothetical protein